MTRRIRLSIVVAAVLALWAGFAWTVSRPDDFADEVVGPWILEHLARRILRRNTHRVPWADAVIDDAGKG
jgi:hypothetical protein